MNRASDHFNEAMKTEEIVDSATENFMNTVIELVKEISKKDPSTVTETERKFITNTAKFMILGLLKR